MNRYFFVLGALLSLNSFAAERDVMIEELTPPLAPPVRAVGPMLEAPAIPQDVPGPVIVQSPAVPPSDVEAYSILSEGPLMERRLASMKDVDHRYHRGGSRERFCKEELKEICVVVKDPCDKCCEVEVPVCIPGCCELPSAMKCSKGIFGRQITEYCWENGFRLEVVATKHGDFIVHHYGIK